MTTTIRGVTFDTAATPAAIDHGYTLASRQALTGDTLIKVRNLAVKTNLDGKLTKGLQVSTFNPSDLKDPNNFFNFVTTWEATILNMETHFKTYFMESCFNLYLKNETPVTDADMRQYEYELQEFIANSIAHGGDADIYTTHYGTDVTRPTPPQPGFTIAYGGSILRDWHSMTQQQVVRSVQLQLAFVDENVHRQNLVWSFQCILDCIDVDLKAFLLSKLASLPPDVGRTGPMAFFIIAQRIVQTTENLAQKVINGFINLRLQHFEGENVVHVVQGL